MVSKDEASTSRQAVAGSISLSSPFFPFMEMNRRRRYKVATDRGKLWRLRKIILAALNLALPRQDSGQWKHSVMLVSSWSSVRPVLDKGNRASTNCTALSLCQACSPYIVRDPWKLRDKLLVTTILITNSGRS